MTTVLDTSPADAGELRALLERDGLRLSATERRTEAIVGGAFVVAAAGTFAAFGTAGPMLWVPALAAVLLLAIAMNVRFDVGGGFTVPTQIAFVPLMFCVPPAALPAATVAAIIIGRLPAVLQGTLLPTRLLLAVAQCVVRDRAGAGAGRRRPGRRRHLDAHVRRVRRADPRRLLRVLRARGAATRPLDTGRSSRSRPGSMPSTQH